MESQCTYKKENPLLFHPEPSVISVKTNLALRLSGVKTRSAMQVPIDANTLMGANQRIIRCRAFVVNEQIIPKTKSVRRATSTVCVGVLIHVSRENHNGPRAQLTAHRHNFRRGISSSCSLQPRSSGQSYRQVMPRQLLVQGNYTTQ